MLSFISPLRFKAENKSKVQDLFFWSQDVIDYLNVRKPAGCRTLLDKKNRLTCYFFESVVHCLLSPLDNVSANPGCESFTLKCDGGFDLNVNIKDVPLIDVPTCDLLPVITNTTY